MDKVTFRKQIRGLHHAYGLKEREQCTASILRQIGAHSRFRKARCLLLYSPLQDEPDIRPLFAQCLAAGKRVLLPIVHGQNLYLGNFRQETDLHTGAFGISEPPATTVIPLSEIDMALIPGMAFDPQGYRLGRGKGYYDRFLSQSGFSSSFYRLGICFPWQRFPLIPHDAWDVTMHEVLTGE